MKNLLLVFITPLLILGCGPQSDKSVDNDETDEIKEEGLPVYNIDSENFVSKEIKLSDFVNDDLEIIPLETCLDCFIGHPLNMVIEDEFILVGSLTGSMKPGELLRFSRDGEFEYKFGKGGRGPGEHVGWGPRNVKYYKEDSTVMVVWGGGQTMLQLFDINGGFKSEMRLPYNSMTYTVERWSESIWFATGQNDCCLMLSGGDSLKVVFFSEDGDLVKKVPRTNYLSLNNTQKTLYFLWPLPYKHNETWKFNMRGNDTLFSIVNMNLEASAIMETPDLELPLAVRVLRETNTFLMLDVIKFKVEKGMSDEDWRSIIFIDKQSKKTYSVNLLDNVFYILNNFVRNDGDFIKQHFEWKNDRLTFAISAAEWMERAKEMDTSKLRPTIREKLKVLEGLSEDDNPIIFTFTLKDEIDFEQ